MKFIDAIEELSKSGSLHEGKIENFTREILEKSSLVLECERCNAWVFNDADDQLESLLSYSSKTREYTIDGSLYKKDLPGYFSFLKKNKLIVSAYARKEPMNAELLNGYLIPNNIMSMIDVPLRSEGKMIGVICFEHVNKIHNWTHEEQKFTQSVAQLLSLALETKEKKTYREELERIILQKEVLIAEINHRVKNNMSVIVSLLKLQERKTRDDFHRQLFNEIQNKVYSISAVQEQLHSNDNIDRIDFSHYIRHLTENIHSSYAEDKVVHIEQNLDSIELDVLRAIPCGLIANEVLTNCYKYAFNEFNLFPKLTVKLIKNGKTVQLSIKDNGKGFIQSEINHGMGIELIQGLAEQIDGEITIDTADGVETRLKFTL